MKTSVLAIFCTVLALANGIATPVDAAILSGGYNIGALNLNCRLSGQGSASLNEGSPACVGYVDSGSFLLQGSGDASYDTLRATAYAGLSNLDPVGFVGTLALLADATGIASYRDDITIDIPGRTGQIVDLIFTTAMNGTLSSAADPVTQGSADASLQANVNGARVIVSRSAASTGTTVSNDFNPGVAQIVLGLPFSVVVDLRVRARLQSLVAGGASGAYSADALADFSNSGGITSFRLFETGGGAEITDWNLSSESGQFGFYAVVPVPSSAWLFGSGVLGLIGLFRRQITA